MYDNSLIPVEQQGVASKMTGKQFSDFAREAAAGDVQRAVDAANAAEKSKVGAESEADRSQSEADRAEDLRESIEVDYEALHRAVEDTESHADRSADEADRARDEADRSGDNAALSESWAVGGTGTRQGEDETTPGTGPTGRRRRLRGLLCRPWRVCITLCWRIV